MWSLTILISRVVIIPHWCNTLCRSLFQDVVCEYSKFKTDRYSQKRSQRYGKSLRGSSSRKLSTTWSNQQVSFHFYAAKGPMFARSLARRSQNEEFCSRLCAHFLCQELMKSSNEVEEHWNEFGIVRTVPPPKAERDVCQPGVLRSFSAVITITYNDNGIPEVISRACIVCVHVSSQDFVVSLVCFGSAILLLFMIGLQSPPEGLAVERAAFAWLVGALFVLPSATLKKSVPTDLFTHTRSRLNSFPLCEIVDS
jgi:hypothetical protein